MTSKCIPRLLPNKHSDIATFLLQSYRSADRHGLHGSGGRDKLGEADGKYSADIRCFVR